MVKENRHERGLERRERLAVGQRAGPEAGERNAPHGDLVVQHCHRIRPVVPQRRPRVHRAGAAGVLVIDEQLPGGHPLVHQPSHGDGIVLRRRELEVGGPDGELVVAPDPGRVRPGQVDAAVAHGGERRRVVHHGRAVAAARREIVLEAERVSHFVRGKLTNPGQGRRGHGRPARRLVEIRQVGRVLRFTRPGDSGRRRIGRGDCAGEPATDEHVLPDAQGAEQDIALQDFARARVDDGPSVGPAARRAVHPVDHVVPNVHRIHVGGQHFHLEGVHEPSGLERLVPPRGTLDERLANGLRSAVVHVVDERVNRLGRGRRGAFFSSRKRIIQRCSSGASMGDA